MTNVVMRTATAADADAMSSLLGQLGYPVSPEDMPARLARLTASPSADAILAILGDRVAGLATMQIISPINRPRDVAWLTTLVVDQALRGTGVGRALVAEVERRARAAGCERLTVTTHEDRADAQAFYRNIGFELTGRRFGRMLE